MSCMPCDVAGAGVCRVRRVMSQVQVYVVYAV